MEVCKNGNLNCLLSHLQEYSRVMDELSYQLDVSDTFSYSDDDLESLDDLEDLGNSLGMKIGQKYSDLEHFELCPNCAQAVPSGLEDCLNRWKCLLVNSVCSLRKLRTLASGLKKRLNRSSMSLKDKNLHIGQLEEAVKLMGNKIELLEVEADKKATELAMKLNENYRLVAELSSDNLRLSTEKAAAEQLLDEVKHEQSQLRSQLNKAQKVIEDTLTTNRFQPQPQMRQSSSPETSASSFDFFPTTTSTVNNRASNRRRGSLPPPRGRSSKRNAKWNRSSGTASDERPQRPDERPQRPKNVCSDVSSPDLGVDLGSDPFSSLERPHTASMASLGNIQQILEENKRLKNEKERLSEKLSQSKGALRDTLDRLHKKSSADNTLSPMPSRRLFSSAVAAAVSSNQPQPNLSLKEEFLAFSKSHRFHNKSGNNSGKKQMK